MTFKKICPNCNKEFISFVRGRENCYICQPYNVSVKDKQIVVITPTDEEREELKKTRKSVEEILEEAKEKGTV